MASGLDPDGVKMHCHRVNPHLQPEEIDDLVAFPHTLTDETALPAIPAAIPSGVPVLR